MLSIPALFGPIFCSFEIDFPRPLDGVGGVFSLNIPLQIGGKSKHIIIICVVPLFGNNSYPGVLRLCFCVFVDPFVNKRI
jgi:hypothetical protein